MTERSVRVWDLPLRLFHWLLVICVSGSIISVKLGGNWMIWHGRFGLAVIGLLSFRLVWGVAGSTHARFVNFFPTPGRLRDYLRGKWRGLGHSPLGALSVFALLFLFGFQALSGLVSTDDIAFSGPLSRAVSSDFGSLVSGWHRLTEIGLYILVGLHVLAIVVYRLRGHDLPGPMIHGDKTVTPERPVEPARGVSWPVLLLALMLAAVAVWVASGAWVPTPAPAPAVPVW